MTPQSVGSIGVKRRLVEEFYNLPIHVNPGLILGPLLIFKTAHFSVIHLVNLILQVIFDFGDFRVFFHDFCQFFFEISKKCKFK